MPPRLSKWLFRASLVPPWCLADGPIGPFLPPWCLASSKWLFPASLVPPRLSKGLFPASLVPPWCLADCPIDPFLPPWCFASCPNGSFLPPWCLPGCRINPFLPPWCLPGASQTVQLIESLQWAAWEASGGQLGPPGRHQKLLLRASFQEWGLG